MKHLIISGFACMIVLLVSCVPDRKQQPSSPVFVPGKRLAELKTKKLSEVSGLAASIVNPGMLWTHNDSGNKPEIYLIDLETNIKRTYELAGIDNRDWEDIAIGPGPDKDKTYIYVGEIGDNKAYHMYKYIYRFEEPVYSEGIDKIKITTFDTITFKLSDVKLDTETLLLDPKTKDLYVISKWNDPVHVYQLKYPYSTHDTIVAPHVSSLKITKTVGGDFSKDGNELLIKSYDHIYYWKNDENKSVVDLLKQSPIEVLYEAEPQGEAIAWSQDDSGFYTLSELNKDKKSFLYFYQRK